MAPTASSCLDGGEHGVRLPAVGTRWRRIGNVVDDLQMQTPGSEYARLQ
jgi:hypothetical protein